MKEIKTTDVLDQKYNSWCYGLFQFLLMLRKINIQATIIT